MAKPSKPAWYAVRTGRKPGVYRDWPQAEEQVKAFTGALHKKFCSEAEARAFVDGVAPTSTRTLESYVKASGSGGTKQARARDEEGDSLAPDVKRAKVTSGSGHEKVFGKNGADRTVFTDGSSIGNGQVGSVAGYGVFWSHERTKLNLSERLPGEQQTNNRAEMFAVARVLETDPNPHLPLTICTDSTYTIKVFDEWIDGWRRKDWKTSTGKPVMNRDLIEYILALLADRMPPNSSSKPAIVTFVKVKAHVGIEGNEMADKLAKKGAALPAVKERDFASDIKKVEARLARRGLPRVTESIKFEVDIGEDDLLTEEELREMSENQSFD